MGRAGGEDLSGAAKVGKSWPAGARRVVTGLLLYHLAALLAGALAAQPASPLEGAAASLFQNYFGLVDLGYAYRFYAPEPPPTAVVTATLKFRDGSERTVRLPDRGLRPRLLYQRHLALANTLGVEVESARREREDPPNMPPRSPRSSAGEGAAEDGPPPKHRHDAWARSYARHLCLAFGGRGCVGVTLYLRMHLIPELGRVRAALEQRLARRVDLDAEEFYTVPERIGDFACDDF